MREGRALVEAVRHYGRILQVGSQQRSMETNRVACEFVRSGRLGKVLEVRAINYTGPKAAPSKPIPRKQCRTDSIGTSGSTRPLGATSMDNGCAWMQWRDFSGGEMTNWGAHGVDQIQWALGNG